MVAVVAVVAMAVAVVVMVAVAVTVVVGLARAVVKVVARVVMVMGGGGNGSVVGSLAGSVGDMLATRRQHVIKLPNSGQHANFCQHKKYPDTRILRRKSPTNCRYCSRYRYCSTKPQGWKNTVFELNKSNSSGHVKVLTLVLSLVRWWC